MKKKVRIEELYKTRQGELEELKRRLETPGIIAVTGEAGSGKTTMLKALSEEVDSIAIFPEKYTSNITIMKDILSELKKRLGIDNTNSARYKLYELYETRYIDSNLGHDQLHDMFVDLVSLYNRHNDKTLTIIVDTERGLQDLETFFTPLPEVNVVYSTEDRVEDGILLAPISSDVDSGAKTPLEQRIVEINEEYGLSGEPILALYDHYLDTYGTLVRDLFGYLLSSEYGISREDLDKIFGEIPEELLSTPLLDVRETVQFASPDIAFTLEEIIDPNDYVDKLSEYELTGRARIISKLLEQDEESVEYITRLIERGEGEEVAQTISFINQSNPEFLLDLTLPKGNHTFYKFLLEDLPAWIPDIDRVIFDTLEEKITDRIAEREYGRDFKRALDELRIDHDLRTNEYIDMLNEILFTDSETSLINALLYVAYLRSYDITQDLYVSFMDRRDLSSYDNYERLYLLFNFLSVQIGANDDIDIADRLEEAGTLIATLEDADHYKAKLDSYRAMYDLSIATTDSERILLNVLATFEADAEDHPVFANLYDLLTLYYLLIEFYMQIGRKGSALQYGKKLLKLSETLARDYRLYSDIHHYHAIMTIANLLYTINDFKADTSLGPLVHEIAELLKRGADSRLTRSEKIGHLVPLLDLFETMDLEKSFDTQEIIKQAIMICDDVLFERHDRNVEYFKGVLMIEDCLNYTADEEISAYSDAVLSYMLRFIYNNQKSPKLSKAIERTIRFIFWKVRYILENEVELRDVVTYSNKAMDLLEFLDSPVVSPEEIVKNLHLANLEALLEMGNYEEAYKSALRFFRDTLKNLENGKELGEEIKELFTRYGLNFDPNRSFSKDVYAEESLRVLFYRAEDISENNHRSFAEKADIAKRVIELAKNDESLLDNTRRTVIAEMLFILAVDHCEREEIDEAIAVLKEGLSLNASANTRLGLQAKARTLIGLRKIETDEEALESYFQELNGVLVQSLCLSFNDFEYMGWKQINSSLTDIVVKKFGLDYLTLASEMSENPPKRKGEKKNKAKRAKKAKSKNKKKNRNKKRKKRRKK